MRMIAKVPAQRTQRPRCLFVIAAVLCGQATQAHDFERTQVTLTFARDGSFVRGGSLVLEVANDAAWLEPGLIPFRDAEGGGSQPLADRVVLFVDGREVRPTVVERISGQPPLTIYRLRGRVPPTAQSLRWY